MKLKITVLMFSIVALVNCAPGKDGVAQMAGSTTPATQSNPVNDTPTVIEAVSDAGTSSTTKKKNALIENIGNFIKGFFGSTEDTPATNAGNSVGHTVKCGFLPSLLSMGSNYLTGGNAIVGSLVSNVATSLLKCEAGSSLSHLIPTGSSDHEKIFEILAEVLKLKEKNLDITKILAAIKNPQDLSGMANILKGILEKTNNKQILDVLNMVNLMQAANGQVNNNCGSMNVMACQVFNIINKVRAEGGLNILKQGATCVLEAQSHSTDMSLNNLLSHLSSNGMGVKDRLAQLGIGSPWAELIVKGSTLTAEGAVKIWMESEGHRNNILNTNFASMGVGFSNGYFTTCFSK